MKKVIFLALIVLFLSACSEETAKVDGEAYTYEEIQEKIKQAESELGKITDNLKKNKEKYDELEELASNRDQLKKDVSKAKDTLKTLKTDIDETTKTLKGLNEKVTKANGKPTELGAGQYVVGEDIPPRKYKITPVNGSGNLFIDNELLDRHFSVTLGNGQFSEPSYTIFLTIDDTLDLGVSAKFTPVE